MQHSVGGDRRLPRERLVDPGRAPVGVHQQILRPLGKAERRAGHGLPGLDLVRPSGRALGGRGRAGKRRLVAKASRDVHGPEKHLHHVQRPAGLEPVGVGGDAAHRVERDRAPAHRLVAAAVHVRPRDVEGDGLRERGVGHLRREPPDGGGGHPGRGGDRVRGVPGVEAAPGEELEGGPRGRSVREVVPAPERGAARRVRGGAGEGRRRGPTRAAGPSPSRAKSPSRASPGASTTSHGAFVYDARYPASTLPERSSSWASERTRRPSVPGVIPIHSSAIAEYPVRTGLTDTTLAPRSLSLASPSLMGLLSWSSATPSSMNHRVCSQSGSPNSQNDPPIE